MASVSRDVLPDLRNGIVKLGRQSRRILAWIGYVQRRLGLALTLSVFLSAICAAAIAEAMLLRHGNTELVADIHHAVRANSASAPPSHPQSASADLQTFVRQLPAQSELPLEVERLFALAQKNGLRLERGDYQPTADTSAKIFKYAINLPVKGPASSVVSFVLQALNEAPTLGLQGISFKRDETGQGRVDQPSAIPLPSVPFDTSIGKVASPPMARQISARRRPMTLLLRCRYLCRRPT
ncbi:hypothetical protein AB4851_30170 [Burkholderia sp. 22PA0099]|uniref:hypothetical protein n=1 Tax=Burkholderia sp. 22PA0099 TaxID=3237372 RepID=UPI0039C14BFD